MSFNSIKGQDHATSFLKEILRSGKMANAYIFSGPTGIGKRLTALNFAKAVNCLSSNSYDSCDNCSSCRKIDSFNHADVRLITPEKGSMSVRIEDVRSLIKDMSLKPYEAKRKIYIIDEANGLTDEAANALLKTLEEPLMFSTIILITESSDQLLPTIRSRCQAVKFYALDTSIVEDVLVTEHQIGGLKARLIARISCGSPGNALRLMDDNFFIRRERIIESLLSNTFQDIEFDKAYKIDLRAVLNIMLTWYRDILIAKFGDVELFNMDKKDMILVEAGKMSFEKVDHILKNIISTQAYLNQNANAKLAMTALGMTVEMSAH